jgi:hypothetical protein
VMVPLSLLPFDAAAGLFGAGSIAAFAATVAWWIGRLHGRATGGRQVALALAAGLYPPVYGSMVMGQANLLMLPLLGAGAALVVGGATAGRRFAGGTAIGLAAIVKLVPGAVLVPIAMARRWSAAAGLVLGATVSMALAVGLAPFGASGGAGLASLFEPDAFYSNQSINGFVTRLVQASDKSLPIVAGAFDPYPVMAAATVAFGLVTLALLRRGRASLATPRGVALGLGFSLVAAVAGAPKDSFWNEAMVLPAVGLLLALDAPGLRFDGFDRLGRCLLGAWFGSAVLWVVTWAVEPPASGPLSAVVTLAWSVSLFGLLALWLLLARRLAPPQATASTIS